MSRQPDLVLAEARLLGAGRPMDLIVGQGRLLAVEPAAGRGDWSAVTKVIDCGGRTVLPGFIDAHAHLWALAESLVTLDLSPAAGVRSLAELLARLAEAARSLPPGAWLRAKSYDEFALAEGRHPLAVDLDRAVPDHPVKLSHRSGQAHVLNSLGLRLAGITAATPEPPGGFIDRLVPSGEPSGLLFHLGGFLAGRVPALEESELGRGLVLAEEALLAQGVTALHEVSAANDPERVARLRVWRAQGPGRPWLAFLLGPDWLDWLIARPQERTDPAGPITGIKIILEDDRGRLHPGPDKLGELLWRAHRAGLQVAVHAVEEPALTAAAEAFGRVLADFPRPHRHRLEHGALCRPALAQRLAGLGLTVVAQPGFIARHGDRYLATVAEADQPWLYPFRTYLEAGVALAAGSDAPLAPDAPLAGIQAAVTRRTEAGRLLNPGQALTLAQAATLHTSAAAWAMTAEAELGLLAPGRRADLVLLSHDLERSPAEEWDQVRVEATFLAGRRAWPEEP